jgi:hypothetical protein
MRGSCPRFLHIFFFVGLGILFLPMVAETSRAQGDTVNPESMTVAEIVSKMHRGWLFFGLLSQHHLVTCVHPMMKQETQEPFLLTTDETFSRLHIILEKAHFFFPCAKNHFCRPFSRKRSLPASVSRTQRYMLMGVDVVMRI